MKVAIFGATGLLGRECLSQCLEADHDVTVLLRTPSKLPAELRERVTVVEGDGLDPEAVDLAAKEDQRLYAEARADEPVAWPPRTDGPMITYTTIPPHLDPALADDPATRVAGWKPTRDLPDDWQGN